MLQFDQSEGQVLKPISKQMSEKRIIGNINELLKKEYIHKIIKLYQGDILIKDMMEVSSNVYAQSVKIYDEIYRMLFNLTLESLHNILIIANDIGIKIALDIITNEFRNEGFE